MINMYPFRNAVTVSHMMMEPYARQAHVLVDMTCGNGHDTAFLARLMPDDAVLYALISSPVPLTIRSSACSRKGWTGSTSSAPAVLTTNSWPGYRKTWI